MFDREKLRGIIEEWMDNFCNKTGQPYIYWDDLARKIEDFVEKTIGGIQCGDKLTDEVAVEQLKKSGWLERHDAEVERRVSVNEFINTVMARGDKSIRISIDPWRWED